MSLIKLDSETKIDTPDDLRQLTNNNEMKDHVRVTYAAIDLPKTFAELIDCGKLLQIAYAAAGKQPCSVKVLDILSQYQDAVHYSTVTSHEFVQTSIAALKCHKEAIDIVNMADNDEDMFELNEEAITPLIACYDYANEMQKKAETAANKIHMREEKTTVEQAIILLGFTNQILCGVKVTFMNVATFWTILAGQCTRLIQQKDNIQRNYDSYLKWQTKGKEKVTKTFKQKTWNSIMEGGQQWAAVGVVSLQAHDGILTAKDAVDRVMNEIKNC